MPRQARIDAPGALHHVIARGIERNEIFRDDADREHAISARYSGDSILNSLTPLLTHARDIGNALA